MNTSHKECFLSVMEKEMKESPVWFNIVMKSVPRAPGD